MAAEVVEQSKQTCLQGYQVPANWVKTGPVGFHRYCSCEPRQVASAGKFPGNFGSFRHNQRDSADVLRGDGLPAGRRGLQPGLQMIRGRAVIWRKGPGPKPAVSRIQRRSDRKLHQ